MEGGHASLAAPLAQGLAARSDRGLTASTPDPASQGTRRRIRRLVAGLLPSMLVALVAGCGTPPALPLPPPTPSAATAGQRTALPLPTIPPGPVTFIVEEGGGTPAPWHVPAQNDSRAAAADFSLLADLLRAAQPAGSITTGAPSPGALRILVPAPPGNVRWVIGFAGGQRVTVAPDVARCALAPGPGTPACPPDPAYAVLGNAPAHAPGLVTMLQHLTAHLALVTPLVVDPTTVLPSATLQVTGQGWLGPVVHLALVWQQGTGAVRPITLGAATVRAGRFRWSGLVPSALQDGTYAVQAEDTVRSADAPLQVR